MSGLGIMAKKVIDQEDCKVAEFMYEVCKNSRKEHTSTALHQDNEEGCAVLKYRRTI